MKLILTILLLFSVSVFAETEPEKAKATKESSSKVNSKKKVHDHDHKGGKHDHKDAKVESKKISKDKVLIKVKGMVCSFCAQGVTKSFNDRKEVKSTKVDLDKMEVLVTLKEGQSLSEKVIKEVVTDAGFSYVEHK